jgi:hypothetical protein
VPPRIARLASRAVRWSGCRFLPGGIILGYHRTASVPVDPWQMCVRPDNLAQHLEVLVRRTRPVSLHTLASVPRGQPGRR